MIYETIKSVLIIGTETNESPSQHIKYQILIKGEVRSWTVMKRYSEFYELNQQLLKQSTNGHPLPTQLPPKTGFLTCISFADDQLVDFRQHKLQDYLQSVLNDEIYSKNENFIQFLNIPAAKGNLIKGIESHISNEGWLKVYSESQGLVREIRAQLILREGQYQKRNLNLAHQTTAQARKLMVNLTNKLQLLQTALDQIHHQLPKIVTIEEQSRRKDLLYEINQHKSNLIQHINRTLPSEPTSPNSGRQSVGSDRSELLPQSKRIFGRIQPKENNETRGLDNEGLVLLQKNKMLEQDDYLSQFSNILQNQKNIGLQIHDELTIHNSLLSELDDQTNSTQHKLKSTTDNVKNIH